ncbi:hypothetical protein ACQRIT_003565 [Beauveria bassiana]
MTDSSPMAPAKPNTKRPKNDSNWHRSRLADATFNAKRYPDPLKARPSPDPRFGVPEGVTAEMTQKWLNMIKESKTQTPSS